MDETWRPDSHFTEEEWVFEARNVRKCLANLGLFVPNCLAGEEKDCGGPAWIHYAAYLSMLKARAQAMIQTNLSHPAPGMAEHFGEVAYQEHLADFLQEMSGE